MLNAGQNLMHYRLVEQIGSGGMGVVWKAVDTTLDREVAIKVLPDLFTGDNDRLARFEREARLLASLDHPNIATVHGLHEAGGVRFLAMELVDGEDLAERLARGPLAIDDALDVARQVAEALESAHDNGVIHRDLKPANIKVDPGGRVKVLDFGLAKAFEPDPASASQPSSLTASPTLTSAGTQAGVILGTAAYMSPEQARGRAVDKRSDIWSFGCVLFEMLTARAAFGGETVSDTIAGILRGQPDWSGFPEGTPASIRRLLDRCLTKDPKRRLRDIGDAVLEIDAPIEQIEAGSVASVKSPAGAVLKAAPWVAVALVSLAAMLLMWGPWRERDRPRAIPSRLSINLPEVAPLAPAGSMPFGVGLGSLSLTDDGTQLVYVALVDGDTQLYVRDMRTGEVRAIPGTEGGFGPFVSPDGRWVAFFANEKLLKTQIEGGQPEVLADATFPYGGHWVSDGNIYFCPREGHGVFRIPATGGTAEKITKRWVSGQAWPRVLPGGEAMLITSFDESTLLVRFSDPDNPQVLLFDSADARYVATGHLLFSRRGRLLAVPFDLDGYRVTGEPVTLLDDIRTEALMNAQYSLADDGTLVYAAGLDSRAGYPTWVDRSGVRERLGLPRQIYGAFSVSPDGRRVALPVVDGDAHDIWIYDSERMQSPTRLTFGGYHFWPVWGPDGRMLTYASSDADQSKFDIIVNTIDGGRREGTRLVEGAPTAIPSSITPDGGELIFMTVTAETGQDLWRAPIEIEASSVTLGEPSVLLATPHLEVFAETSPDGRWLTYTSDETDSWEIYVASYPDLDKRVRVSTDGGEESMFSPDGSELIYRWGSQWFVADVSYEPELRCSKPRVLFEGPYINLPGYSWDMSSDAERFLVIEGTEQDKTLTELVVLTHFLERLP